MVHAVNQLGLKMGVWHIRGAHSSAVKAKLPVAQCSRGACNDSGYTADQIVMQLPCPVGCQACNWNPYWIGVNASHPGAKIWYESLASLFIDEWGLDFVKFDCSYVDFPMKHGADSMREIDLFYTAMMARSTKAGNKPILSLSPGGVRGDNTREVHIAEALPGTMYRIWPDYWGGLPRGQLSESLALSLIGIYGANSTLPDWDLLAGIDQLKMILWSISGSPIFYSAKLPATALQLGFLTQALSLRLNSEATDRRPFNSSTSATNSSSFVFWAAGLGEQGETAVAVVNTGKAHGANSTSFSISDVGLDATKAATFDVSEALFPPAVPDGGLGKITIDSNGVVSVNVACYDTKQGGETSGARLITIAKKAALKADDREAVPSGLTRRDLRMLVVLGANATRETHSQLFAALTARGHALEFAVAGSAVADGPGPLQRHGVWRYGAVVLLAPSAEEFGPELPASALLSFVDGGGDLIVSAAATTGAATRQVAAGCGLTLEARGKLAIDHAGYDTSADAAVQGGHTVLAASSFGDARVAGKPPAPVLFRGIGMAAAHAGSELVLPLLRGSAAAYSHAPATPVKEGSTDVLAGSKLLLVAGMQARNGARALVCGSLELLSDAYAARQLADSRASGNGAFVDAASAWALHHTGALRVVGVYHRLLDGAQVRKDGQYRIKDEIVHGFKLEERVGEEWVGYEAADVQVELVMLDPYIRRTMPSIGGGEYRTTLTLPDQHGVFKLVLKYARPGLTTVRSEEQLSIRPLRHDEFERFIFSALPYYASSFSVMLSFWLVSAFFLRTL